MCSCILRDELSQWLKDLDQRIDFIEYNLNMQEDKDTFDSGRLVAFNEIRCRLYNILQKDITYNTF